MNCDLIHQYPVTCVQEVENGHYKDFVTSVCGVILGFLMKGTKPEYACFITVGIGLVIMGLAVGKIYYLFESLGKIQETLPVDTEYISTLVKMIGITYIGQFAPESVKMQATAQQRRRLSCSVNCR